jgi:hypothetical protein
MSELIETGHDTPLGDELKRRLMAIAVTIEDMGKHSGRLLEVMNFGCLPDSVLKQIEDTLRPFTASICQMKEECRGFQEYSKRFEEEVSARQRSANYEAFFGKPEVGKVVN